MVWWGILAVAVYAWGGEHPFMWGAVAAVMAVTDGRRLLRSRARAS